MTRDGDYRVIRRKFLRRYRIAELPQIITTIRGEMSWIGPRPEAVAFDYIKKISFWLDLLIVAGHYAQCSKRLRRALGNCLFFRLSRFSIPGLEHQDGPQSGRGIPFSTQVLLPPALNDLRVEEALLP